MGKGMKKGPKKISYPWQQGLPGTKGPDSTARLSDTSSRTLLAASREGFLTGKRIALSQKRVSRSSPETPQEPNFGSRTMFDLSQGVPRTARGIQIVPRGGQFFLQRAPRSPPRARRSGRR